ncbi:hypothetical protein JCM10212_005914 [Sporobolomyces blumeae]
MSPYGRAAEPRRDGGALADGRPRLASDEPVECGPASLGQADEEGRVGADSGAASSAPSPGGPLRRSAPGPSRRVTDEQASPSAPRSSGPTSSPRSPRFPNLAASTSSPRPAYDSPDVSTPPRRSSLRQASATPRSPAANALSAGGVGESSRSTGSTRSNSTRRKPPPPLDFVDGSTGYESVRVEARQSPVASVGRDARSWVPETPDRADEERDTVSNMVEFRASASESPVIQTSIPSATLGLAGEEPAEADDDTVGSGFSYLSTSTSSGFDQPRPYKPSTSFGSSTTSYDDGAVSRPYQGLGLGLPFSVSAAANLSSLASSAPLGTTSSSSSVTPIAIPSPPTTSSAYDPYRSPHPADRASESPGVDRGQLIGLGELATPRWTSAALERRWGAPDGGSREGETTDVFNVHDPMPARRNFDEFVESPIAARLPTRATGFDSSSPNRPFGHSGTASLQPASLLPNSASTNSIAASLSPGLLNFGQDSTSTFGTLEFTPSSPAFSLDAASSDDSSKYHSASAATTAKDAGATANRAFAGPRRGEPDNLGPEPVRRKSFGAAASAPPSAGAGASWTLGSDRDVVGLGFNCDDGLTQAAAAMGDEASQYAKRRMSQGSVASTATTKRSSNRSSIDGKASLKHRRQSASKSSFAHLPPSPAAATASHVLSSSTSSATPPAVPPIGPPPGPAQSVSSQSTPSTRTPDHSRVSRHSFHSHHSSPSLVAASILRHTRDLEGVDLDIERAAAVDEGTAEALRKLDGLSSPRMSRIASNSSAIPAEARSRKSSRGTLEMPPNPRQNSDERIRRRTRSSAGSVAREGVDADQTGTTQRNNASPGPTPVLPSPSVFSAPFGQPSNAARSPLALSTSFGPSARPGPTRVSSASNYEVPFPSSSSSPFKRGSSSSTSFTAATSTSASGSHDSTSGTSFATRSAASKMRRSSAGSDVSSVHSGSDARPGVDRKDSSGETEPGHAIPPVPPLPKDWETYRPTASGTAPLPPPLVSTNSSTSTATSNSLPSPHLDQGARRPSFASSLENASRSSPRVSQSDASSGKEGQKEPSGRRKWSISTAFHKASKSPKSTPGIKESSSFSDLQATAPRDRKTSFGARLGDGSQLPKRMASSTSDIASLASGREEGQPASAGLTTGSLGRNSLRGDKASMIARVRTSSQSSTSTARTAQHQAFSSMPTPSVVTTSPGRSRSSLINPRRTPSGIPFFSRKSSQPNEASSAASTSLTPSPNAEKNGPSPAEERSGRKSILGLNFLRSGASRREREKSTFSPPSAQRPGFSTSTSTSSLADAARTDEFGRRASKTSDLLTRKRGKTIGSVDAKNDDVFGAGAKPVQLPPFQISALPSSTSKRVDALNASQSSASSVASSSRVPASPAGSIRQTPRTRTSKLQESMKANLPTIAGSPSTHVPRRPLVPAATVADDARSRSQDPSPAGTPPPKSHTPTKIPRLNRITPAASPKPRISDSSGAHSPNAPSFASRTSHRKVGSFGGAGDTSNPLSASFSGSHGPSPHDNDATSEFGSVSREPGLQLGEKTLSTRRRLESDATIPSGIPRSKSTANATLGGTKTTQDVLSSSTPASRQSTALPRAARRPSAVDEEKPSASTIAATPARASQPRLSSLSASASRSSSQVASDSGSSSSASTAQPPASAARRAVPKATDSTPALRRSSLASSTTTKPISTSKSMKTLSTGGAIPTRVSKSSSSFGSARISPSGTESGRSSAASNREADEDEIRGDEEMAAYVRRQFAKKLHAGHSEETIRKMFEFPEPTDPLPPLDAKDAAALYSRYLSPYEKEEIRDYRKVYFVGPNSLKKAATKENSTNNHGYDDERGDYELVTHDHLHYRYEVISVLGKGSFGQVLQCRDHKTGEMVAIKIIRNKKRFHHQALVEIKVLENLVKWDPDERHFVIRMVDSFTFRGHLCIVTELLSINLYELVKANSFAGFSTGLIRRFTVQILGSLSLLRHHRVVHCDLKPENILLKHPAKSAIKVIDFGSSCFEHEKVYTYIQSRFYRSPEVILGMNYHMGIDMWSLGCIIAEMYTGYPIFPGENEQEQLACIMEVMGLPEKYLVDRSSRKRLFFDSTGAPRPVVNSKGRRRRPGSKTLAQVLKTDDELFIDFIAKCLMWDPDRRLKPDPAMRHPWITQTRGNAANPPTIPPPRMARSSALPTSSSTRVNSINSSSPNISTPLKKQPQPASTATAPLPRTRTFSTATVTGASATRLGSKASLGLPPSSRYQVKS